VVNGHKSAAHTDSPDGSTGKTCLGGGMRCPNASSLNFVDKFIRVFHCLRMLSCRCVADRVDGEEVVYSEVATSCSWKEDSDHSWT